MIMDEFTRTWVHAQAQREQLEAGLEGDFSDALYAQRVAEATEPEQGQWPTRHRVYPGRVQSWEESPVRSGVRVMPILIFAVIVIVALIIFAH